MRRLNVAIAGATGAVGAEMIGLLEERNFPVRELTLLASARSAGKTLAFRGKPVKVRTLTRRSFKGVDLALFSAGGARSIAFAPSAVRSGAVVVDNSSAFRMDDHVPLVVPEVNARDIASHKGIIANPNCTTIILLMGVNPLKSAGLKRLVVASYQAVSGAGTQAMEEMKNQTLSWALSEMGSDLLGEPGRQGPAPELFPQPIAFNCFPHIGSFDATGYSTEEIKCLKETRKILHNPDLRVTATTVRVPVWRSHCIAVHLETEKSLSVARARKLIREAEGVQLLDAPAKGQYPTPMMSQGRDDCFVGRIRKDTTVANGLALWVGGDQLRKGAALNAIQIAERLFCKGKK